MQNGIIEIKVNGVSHTLKFGMMAYEVFVKQILKGIRVDDLSSKEYDFSTENSNVRSLTDLIYAGICNQNYLKQKPNPNYEDVANLVEDILDDENGIQLQNDIWECWNESKAGDKMRKAAGNKKKEGEGDVTSG